MWTCSWGFLMPSGEWGSSSLPRILPFRREEKHFATHSQTSKLFELDHVHNFSLNNIDIWWHGYAPTNGICCVCLLHELLEVHALNEWKLKKCPGFVMAHHNIKSPCRSKQHYFQNMLNRDFQNFSEAHPSCRVTDVHRGRGIKRAHCLSMCFLSSEVFFAFNFSVLWLR